MYVNAWNYIGGGYTTHKQTAKFYFIKPDGKTLIRPVLAYGSETWALSKSDKAVLGVFERKILRTIFGPTNDNGE